MIRVLFFILILALHTPLTAQQLVLPGDYPDPSVVKIGDTYWASATTSNWLPAYPLLKSKDLIRWETTGNIFTTMPEWTDFYFWAPEITYENGKVYIYYTAHKKGGNLCVGIASADKPEGPYKDHGPLICQEVGSIDAFPMRDEAGKLYLVWKEDGNSVGKPTPIWAQEMNEERTALTGEKKELFRGDAEWERKLVEGVSMMRRGDYYYAFYAAAGCCGRSCTYGTGIARAKNLLGPWEKYEKNPVLTHDEEWKCPGHGTPVEKDGRFYFLYHAYDAKENVYTGRQGLLIEFTFTPDGWINFIKQKTPAVAVAATMKDDFNGNRLSADWQWSVFQNIDTKVRKGRLQLGALPAATGAFLGQKTYEVNYTVDAVVFKGKRGVAAGIAAIGDERNTVSVFVQKDSIKVVQVKGNKDSIIAAKQILRSNKTHLRMQVNNGKDITFQYSINGRDYVTINNVAVDGAFLPPWDRAIRAGVVAKGNSGTKAVFDSFTLNNQPIAPVLNKRKNYRF